MVPNFFAGRKTKNVHQSGRHWADSGDTLCQKSYVFGLHFGPDPGPGEAPKVPRIAPSIFHFLESTRTFMFTVFVLRIAVLSFVRKLPRGGFEFLHAGQFSHKGSF